MRNSCIGVPSAPAGEAGERDAARGRSSDSPRGRVCLPQALLASTGPACPADHRTLFAAGQAGSPNADSPQRARCAPAGADMPGPGLRGPRGLAGPAGGSTLVAEQKTFISSLSVGMLDFMSSLLGTQVHSADLADAVSRLRRAMRRAARAADPGSGLSVAQLEMLSCMAENPGSRPGQLARLLRLAPSSVATLSNSLRQAGLVTRTGGSGDRRTASLDLTPAGEAAVLRWKSLNERLLSLALRDLPPESRVTLVDALPALSDLAGAVDALADEPSVTDPLPDEASLDGETSLS